MYIFIDNTEEGRAVFHHTLNNKWEQAIFLYSGKSFDLLSGLQKVLKKTRQPLSGLSGIAVLTGRGSFTSTRIAATFANSLSLALKIPVAGVKDADLKKISAILKRSRFGRYASPVYSGEANIGMKSKNVRVRHA